MDKTQSTSAKNRLRAELLQVRRALDSIDKLRWDQDISKHIQEFIQKFPVRQGVGFLPFPGEPDLRALMGSQTNSVDWGVPLVNVAEGMHVYPWTPSMPLRKNRYGFWEPESKGVALSFSIPTLILVPAVGLDRSGHRLGWGKGHYDRFLAQLDLETCVTMGVVYDACLRESLPQDPWDIPLRYICTQAGWRPTS